MTQEHSDEQVDQARTFYITTAIDYPNGVPHIGHSLEKVAADVIARYHRLLGDDTFFSIGVDENSQHVTTAAEAHGVDTLTWVNTMDEAFRRAWAALDISNDYFIRTTEQRHIRASQEMFRRAQENGDIYKSTYAGWYCPNDNTFYSDDELVNGHCPNHPSIIPDWVEEDNYFFALSKYSNRLLAHINAHPEFIVPVNRRAEVVGLIKQGLRDFAVSRRVRSDRPGWGIPVPGDDSQVIYVWFDALTNYLTAVGFPDDQALFEHYWPANAHVIGKDITRFHCLYWPAMLLSAGLPLPEQVAVHGFITLDGQRISKTAGNTVDPLELVAEYGVDAVRFNLLRNLSFASDGDFSRAGLIRHYNDELANDLGNLLNRVVSMVKRYRKDTIPAPETSGPLEQELQTLATETLRQVGAALDTWDIGNAVGIIWNFVRRVNQYIDQRAPWRLAKQPEQQDELDTILYTIAEATRLIAVFLAPFLPSTSNRVLDQLGLGPVESAAWQHEAIWGNVPLSHVEPGPLLFPRIEPNP